MVFQVAVEAESPNWETVYIDAAAAEGGIYEARWSSGLEDGEYLFRAILYDQADNETMLDPLEVTVDTEAPTVQIAAGSLEPVAATASTTPPIVSRALERPPTT